MYCSNCGEQAPDAAKFCSSCGADLRAETNTDDERAWFVGKRSDIYAAKWRDNTYWNWAAFACGAYWLMYRKMYLYAVLGIVFGFLGIIVPTGLIVMNQRSLEPLAPYIELFIYLILKLVWGIIGNLVYRHHTERQIAFVKSRLPAGQRESAIRHAGGTNLALPLTLFIVKVLLIVSTFAFIIFYYFNKTYKTIEQEIQQHADHQKLERNEQPLQTQPSAEIQPDYTNSELDRELYNAVVDNNPDDVSMLLDKGADPNQSASILAAVRNKNAEIARLLIQHGADPNYFFRGETPLSIAVDQNDIDMAELLLDLGAGPEMGSPVATPLEKAVHLGSTELVMLLLEHGADPDAGLFILSDKPLLELAEQAGYTDIVKLLKKAGAAGTENAQSAGTEAASGSGADIYQKLGCISCHATDLLGLPGTVPSLRGIGSKLSKDEITAVIMNGKGDMPSLSELPEGITDADISLLAEWLAARKE